MLSKTKITGKDDEYISQKRKTKLTDVEEQRRDGRVAVHMDHAQEVGQVALPGAHEEQPLETQK